MIRIKLHCLARLGEENNQQKLVKGNLGDLQHYYPATGVKTARVNKNKTGDEQGNSAESSCALVRLFRVFRDRLPACLCR